jgi:hypothetical protein
VLKLVEVLTPLALERFPLPSNGVVEPGRDGIAPLLALARDAVEVGQTSRRVVGLESIGRGDLASFSQRVRRVNQCFEPVGFANSRGFVFVDEAAEPVAAV